MLGHAILNTRFRRPLIQKTDISNCLLGSLSKLCGLGNTQINFVSFCYRNIYFKHKCFKEKVSKRITAKKSSSSKVKLNVSFRASVFNTKHVWDFKHGGVRRRMSQSETWALCKMRINWKRTAFKCVMERLKRKLTLEGRKPIWNCHQKDISYAFGISSLIASAVGRWLRSGADIYKSL